jgi:integrase
MTSPLSEPCGQLGSGQAFRHQPHTGTGSARSAAEWPPPNSLLRRLALRGLRSEEAIALRRQDVKLPELLLDEERHGWVEAGSAWGELHLRAAMPDVGRQWTDDGSSRDSCGLKQRAEGETRRVPCPPALVDLLREHLAGADGESGQLIFRGIQGCPLPTITYRQSWDRAWARNAVFSVQDYQSPLAHRPYDLRHARLSTWLNSGVPAA